MTVKEVLPTFVQQNRKHSHFNKSKMKKLFLALALTGIVGVASVNTIAAITHSKVVVGGGEEDKKKKDKCKKDKSCCKSQTGATADAKCTNGETKKCCSSATSQKTCTQKTTTTSETKTDVKKAEEVR